MNSIKENNLISVFFMMIFLSIILFFAGNKIGWSNKTNGTIVASMWIFIIVSFFGFIPIVRGGYCHPSGEPDSYRSHWKYGKCE